MFNTINMNKNSTSVNFNAPCTGILQRSHPKSIFVKFQLGSTLSDRLFPKEGREPYLYDDMKDYGEKTIKVVVLQILVFGDS